jgi:GNAT superfamily N-acetyltransferase
MTGLELRPLELSHLGYRTVEDRELDVDWFIDHMADVIEYHPEGCFTLFSDNEPIGMITCTPYQTVGWLGWLYVLEKQRGRGLGAELMKAGIEHLRQTGMKTIVIEAVVEAVSLYKRLGFAEQFRTQHYLLSPERKTFRVADEVEIIPVEDRHIDVLAPFDYAFFRQDRRRLFQIAMRNKGFAGHMARRNGDPAGFLFMTEGSSNRQVSPLIVDPALDSDGAVARSLLAAAFEASSKPLYFRCPLARPERSRPLLECGASEVDYHTIRMFLGEEYSPEPEGVLSLGCPGKG